MVCLEICVIIVLQGAQIWCVQDAAGLPSATKDKYKYSLADTFLLRGTTERMERYNRYTSFAFGTVRSLTLGCKSLPKLLLLLL